MERLMLEAVKRMIEEFETEIHLLSTGRRMISEIRDGKIVDASNEILVQKRVFRDRLSELISKFDATG
jgi:hypothetical protein